MGVAIIVEPKTAPHQTKDQWVYGISLALITLFFQMIKVPNAVVVSLMMANISYFVSFLLELLVITRFEL
jgi:hypothetical protein